MSQQGATQPGVAGGLWQEQGVGTRGWSGVWRHLPTLLPPPFPSCFPPPSPSPGCPSAFLEAQVDGVALSSLVLLPWSLPVYRRMSFSLLPHPWGTSPETRASETSSGQETPGDQDRLRLSWGSTERGLNLATLGRMPELLSCSDLNPEPKITGRCSTRATPAGRTWETGRGACWPARCGRGRLQKDHEMSSCSPPDPTSARLEGSIGRLVQSSGFRKTTL